MKTKTVNRLITAISVAVFTISLQAQDLIVTNEGDSINCKITKVKSDHIYFTFKHKEEIRNTLLPAGQVAFYQKNYFQIAEVPADMIPDNNNFPRYRFAVSGGWSYRTAKLSNSIQSDFRNHYQKLKSGFHYDLGISYYFSELLGVGLKYNEFLTSYETENVYLTYPNGHTEYGNLKDSYRIKFFGPVFCTRLLNSKMKNCLLMELGLGYMDYQDKGNLVSIPVKINGSTVGSYLSIGYDFGIAKDLALGLQLSLLSGILTQITTFDGTSKVTTKLDKDNYEDLSRIEIAIGLRFNK